MTSTFPLNFAQAFTMPSGSSPDTETIARIFKEGLAAGFGCGMTQDTDTDLMGLKADLKEMGADVNTYTCSVLWDDLKKDSNGLVPVVVQDYRNEEVLMVAYMNREAFENTVRTGRMTYWSPSLQGSHKSALPAIPETAAVSTGQS